MTGDAEPGHREGPSIAAGTAAWRRLPGEPDAVRAVWLVARRLGLTALALALIGTMIWLLFGIKRYVPVIGGFASGYRMPFGPLRLGQEDRALLATMGMPSPSLFSPRTIAWSDVSAELRTASGDEIIANLTRRVAAAKPGGPGEDMVIVYLSMLGVIDAGGEPCLVPPLSAETEIGPAASRHVSVRRLLESLRGAVPARVGIVTVLDACHGDLSWPLGIADGGFPVAVQATMAMATETLPRTWVLLPSGPGQTAHGHPLEGGTVFGTLFSRGMRGAADTTPYGNGDGIVDLGEFVAFLGSEVDRRALVSHGEHQTPTLYPALTKSSTPPKLSWARAWHIAEGVERKALLDRVAALPRNASRAGASAESAVDDMWWLAERWKAAAELRSIGQHLRPTLWQAYVQMLMRAEQLRDGGVGCLAELRSVETQAERLELELSSKLFSNVEYLPSIRLQRLARAERAFQVPPDVTAWTAQMERMVNGPQGAPESAIGPAQSASEWVLRAERGWLWLAARIDEGRPVDRGMLERWLAAIGTSPPGITSEAPEIHVARMVARSAPDDLWRSDPTLPLQLIRLVGKSRDALFALDVRTDKLVDLLTPRAKAAAALNRAFDLAFVADPASLAEARRIVDQVDVMFDETVSFVGMISESYRYADQLLDELPWLAAWWSQRQRVAAGEETSENERREGDVNPDWPRILDAVDQFYGVVSQGPQDAIAAVRAGGSDAVRIRADVIERYAGRMNEVKTLVEPLRDVFDNAVADLMATAPDTVNTLARIRRLLSTPLIRGEDRMRLLRRAASLQQRFVLVKVPEAVAGGNHTAPSGERALAAWVSWRESFVHPVARLLDSQARGLAARPVQPAEIAAGVGAAVAGIRRSIDGLAETLAGHDSRSGDSDEQLFGSTKEWDLYLADVERLASLGSMELATRRLTPVSVHDEQERSVAIRTSLLAAWHDRLVTAANEALDDFWAGVDASAPVWCLETAKAFSEVVEDFVSMMRIPHGMVSRRRLADRIAGLDKLLGPLGEGWGRLDVSRAALRVYSRPVLQDIAVRSASLRVEPPLADGVAALWFATSMASDPLPIARSGASGATVRLPLPFTTSGGATGAEWRFVDNVADILGIDPQAASLTAPVVEAIAWFRGHHVVARLPVATGATMRVVEWNAPPQVAPRITVRGDVPRNQSVAIVFDCSGSMGQRLPDGRSRLEAGREALYEVLERLARDGGWNASLWLYGHRTRWSRDQRGRYTAGLTKAGELDRDATIAAGEKFSLVPGDDVEQVMDVQPLVPVQVERIRAIVDAQQPGGETPLYLAIDEALRNDFAGADPGPGHVLVVTDGANDQSGGRIRSSSDVLRTLSAINFRRGRASLVHVDVIGFDLQPNGFDREVRLQDLQSLAADSGGRYFDATDPRKLAGALRASFQQVRFGVVGPNAPATTVEIGDAIEVPFPVAGTSVPYDVVLETGPPTPKRGVRVWGGERLELFTTGRGRALEFRRYDGGTEQGLRDSQTLLPDPENPQRIWFLGAHMALREGAKVRFPLSIQNGQADAFSPRPKAVWIDVQPMTATGPEGMPYTFMDMDFQPGRPVPVLDLAAYDWPANASTATIRSWIHFSAPQPDLAIPLPDVGPIGRSFEVPGLAKSTVMVTRAPPAASGEVVVTVLEEHPLEICGDLPVLHVSLTRGCRRALHITARGVQRVRHEFTVSATDGEIGPEVILGITTRKRFQSNAVGPSDVGGAPEPLIVPVPPPL